MKVKNLIQLKLIFYFLLFFASTAHAQLIHRQYALNWSQIQNMPAGFADGVDDEGTPGGGITSLNGLSATVQFFLSGNARLNIASLDSNHTLTIDPILNNYTWTGTSIANLTNHSHTLLTDIGTNTHAVIDTHLANTSNPHSVTKAQVGLNNVTDLDYRNAANISAGTLAIARGGTGAASLDNLIALTTNTTGNYVASVATTAPLAGGAAGSEGATLTLAVTSQSNTSAGVVASSAGQASKVWKTDAGGAPDWRDDAQGAGGGGSGEAMVKNITQATHGLAVGNVIKFSTTYQKAQADSAANAEVVGIVSVVPDVNNFNFTMGGYISGLSSLSANSVYFLSPTSAGALTATEPTTAGQISKPVLIAVSATEGYIFNFRGIAVSATATGEKGLSIYNITSSHDIMIPPLAYSITLTKVSANAVGGTNVIGRLEDCSANGQTCARAINATDWTITSGTELEITNFQNATIPAGNWTKINITSVSGAVSNFAIGWDFTK